MHKKQHSLLILIVKMAFRKILLILSGLSTFSAAELSVNEYSDLINKYANQAINYERPTSSKAFFQGDVTGKSKNSLEIHYCNCYLFSPKIE